MTRDDFGPRPLEDILRDIRSIEWTLNTQIPNALKGETHARRVASLKRQREEAWKTLDRLTTEYGSAIQEREQ